jgi:hypothetical protein
MPPVFLFAMRSRDRLFLHAPVHRSSPFPYPIPLFTYPVRIKNSDDPSTPSPFPPCFPHPSPIPPLRTLYPGPLCAALNTVTSFCFHIILRCCSPNLSVSHEQNSPYGSPSQLSRDVVFCPQVFAHVSQVIFRAFLSFLLNFQHSISPPSHQPCFFSFFSIAKCSVHTQSLSPPLSLRVCDHQLFHKISRSLPTLPRLPLSLTLMQ